MIFTAEKIKELREKFKGEIKCRNYNECTVVEFERRNEAVSAMYEILANATEPMRITIELAEGRFEITEEFPEEED